MRSALGTRRDVVRAQGQQGASAVEYGLIVSLIAAVLVIVIFALGRIAGGSFGSIDCWSSSGGSACSEAADVQDAPADPVVVAEPAVPAVPVAAAAPVSSKKLCNQSSNGSGKGKGAGRCR